MNATEEVRITNPPSEEMIQAALAEWRRLGEIARQKNEISLECCRAYDTARRDYDTARRDAEESYQDANQAGLALRRLILGDI